MGGGHSLVEAMFGHSGAFVCIDDAVQPEVQATDCTHRTWECERGETSRYMCDCFTPEPQYCDCWGPIPAPAAGEEFDMRDAFQSEARCVDALHKWVYDGGADRVTVLDMNSDESDNDDDVVPDLPDKKAALEADEAAMLEAEQRLNMTSPSGVVLPVAAGTPAMPVPIHI